MYQMLSGLVLLRGRSPSVSDHPAPRTDDQAPISQACQRLDWPSHKPECAALSAFGIKAEALERQAQKSKAPEDDSKEDYARVPSTPVRALARLMWRKERESPAWVRCFFSGGDKEG